MAAELSIKGELRNSGHLQDAILRNQGAVQPTSNILIDCTKVQGGCDEVAITGCTIQHNHESIQFSKYTYFWQKPPAL